jgi:hypothetical protein
MQFMFSLNILTSSVRTKSTFLVSLDLPGTIFQSKVGKQWRWGIILFHAILNRKCIGQIFTDAELIWVSFKHRSSHNYIIKGYRFMVCDTALGYGLDDREFESRQELGIFLFTTLSGPALGRTQPPIQWVPEALSLRVERPGREAENSPPSNAEVKNA